MWVYNIPHGSMNHHCSLKLKYPKKGYHSSPPLWRIKYWHGCCLLQSPPTSPSHEAKSRICHHRNVSTAEAYMGQFADLQIKLAPWPAAIWTQASLFPIKLSNHYSTVALSSFLVFSYGLSFPPTWFESHYCVSDLEPLIHLKLFFWDTFLFLVISS